MSALSHAKRPHYALTFAVLTLAALAFALLQSMVAPALPEMQRALHTSPTGVSWILTAYLLTASVATPIAGRLGDMFGKERVLVIVLVALALGTVISALSTSIGPMLVGRGIQGIGGAVFPLGIGIVRDEFPKTRVATGIGLISATFAVGGGFGIVAAGPIVQHLDYHYLFWIPLVAVVLALVATWLFVPESPVRSPGRVNWLGASLLSGWLVAILLGFSEAPTWGWLSPRVIGLFAVGLVLLAAWVRAESRSAEPLVDMSMMVVRGVWTVNLATLLIGFGMYNSFILIPQFVELPTGTGFGFGASVTRGRALPASDHGAHADLEPDRGPDGGTRRLAGPPDRRRRLRGRSLCAARRCALAALGGLPRGGHPRRRHRPCLRLDGEPDRRGGLPAPDGHRHRHEHDRTHHRRRARDDDRGEHHRPTSAAAQSANAIVNPLSRGRPLLVRLASTMLAAIVVPSAPPTVRAIVFMPVAMPVICDDTASTIRFAIDANARPMPTPRMAAAR